MAISEINSVPIENISEIINLTFSGISEIIGEITSTAPIPTGNLISYYNFDSDGTDSQGSNDLSQISGGTDVTFTLSGKSGNAASADGTNLCGLESSSTDFNFGTSGGTDIAFSMSLYIYADNLGDGWWISKRDGDRHYNIANYLGDFGVYFFAVNNDELRLIIDGWEPPIDTWTHITFTYDGSNSADGMNIYINGALQTTGSTVGTSLTRVTEGAYNGMAASPPAVFRLFDPEFSATYNVAGRIDGFGLWDKELTQGEVTLIYNEQNAGNELV